MQKGEFVKIEYVGRLESGEIFDLTDAELAKKENIFNPNIRYAPVAVIIGAGFVLNGLDKHLQEMKVGEEKEVTVAPSEGFGERKADMVRLVPRKAFKELPSPGMVVDFGDVRGRVQSVEAGRIRVDFNHPLAGKTLKYTVKITEKIEGAENQLAGILEFYGIDPKGKVSLEGETAEIKLRLPDQLKHRIAALAIEHVKGVKKVEFRETFEKPPSEPTEQGSSRPPRGEASAAE